MLNFKHRKLIVLLLIILISTILILLILHSIKRRGEDTTEIISSFPTFLTDYASVPVTLEKTDNFYLSYTYKNLLPVSYTTQNTLGLANLTAFGFNNPRDDNSIRFILVNAKEYQSGKEVYERVNTGLSLSGQLVSTKTHKIKNIEIDMAIKIEALGAGQFYLIGGIKEKSKGYYFSIPLEDFRTRTSYSDLEIEKIFNFEYIKNPGYFLELINKVVQDDLPDKFFNNMTINLDTSQLESLRKSNDYKFPSTF